MSSSANRILARQYAQPHIQNAAEDAQEPIGNGPPAADGLAAQEANLQVNGALGQVPLVHQANVASIKTDNVFMQPTLPQEDDESDGGQEDF